MSVSFISSSDVSLRCQMKRNAHHTNISINAEHPMDNATTKVFDTSLLPLIATAIAADKVGASGSGPRNETSNSSGMKSAKMFTLNASDNTFSMSE